MKKVERAQHELCSVVIRRGLRVSGEDLVSAEAEIRHVFGDKNLTEVK